MPISKKFIEETIDMVMNGDKVMNNSLETILINDGIRRRLQDARRMSGLTQRQANKLFISPNSIIDAEEGLGSLMRGEFEVLATLYKVNVNWLLTGDNEKFDKFMENNYQRFENLTERDFKGMMELLKSTIR